MHEFGGPGKNEFICKTENGFAKNFSCGSNEWCVRSSRAEATKLEKLCKIGTPCYLDSIFYI